jgi:hypothetical protein
MEEMMGHSIDLSRNSFWHFEQVLWPSPRKTSPGPRMNLYIDRQFGHR